MMISKIIQTIHFYWTTFKEYNVSNFSHRSCLYIWSFGGKWCKSSLVRWSNLFLSHSGRHIGWIKLFLLLFNMFWYSLKLNFVNYGKIFQQSFIPTYHLGIVVLNPMIATSNSLPLKSGWISNQSGISPSSISPDPTIVGWSNPGLCTFKY